MPFWSRVDQVAYVYLPLVIIMCLVHIIRLLAEDLVLQFPFLTFAVFMYLS